MLNKEVFMPTTYEIAEYRAKHKVSLYEAIRALKRNYLLKMLSMTDSYHDVKQVLEIVIKDVYQGEGL